MGTISKSNDKEPRTRWSSTVSVRLAEELRTMSKQSHVPMSLLLDEAMDDLIIKYRQYGYEIRKDDNEEMANEHTLKIITIASNKGGVGKSATAGCFSHLLGQRGKKVLLIDTDSQGDVSGDFGYDESAIDEDKRLSNCVLNFCSMSPARPVTDFICETRYGNVDIIPGDESLARTRTPVTDAMMSGINPYASIVNEVRALNKYDYIIMDTRPSIEPDIKPVLIASENVVVPLLTGLKSIEGGNRTIEFMMNIQRQRPDVKIAGIFFNRVNERTQAAHDLIPQAREIYGDFVLKNYIHQNEAVTKAENFRQPLTDRYPASQASKDFSKLLDEVVIRIG